MSLSPEDLRRHLREARTIAVLGAKPNPDRPAFFVPDYLARRGYTLLPVNPAYVGQELWGQPVALRLADLPRADIVDVFRRGELLMEHLDDILAAKPGLVWLQSGIRNDEFARKLEAAGIAVVQDRCLMVEHRRLLG